MGTSFVRRFRRAAVLVPALAAMAANAGAQIQPPNNHTVRVSVNSQGGQASGDSRDASISADGRFVAFSSEASDLVAGDTNFRADIFVHDRQTGRTVRVNVNDQGAQPVDGDSFEPVISANGRFVAFTSSASNLLGQPLAPNVPRPQVYVHDLQTGTTAMISRGGQFEPDGPSDQPSISADGTCTAFRSDAENLVGDLDQNGVSDVFFHCHNGNILASVSSDGQAANGPSSQPSVMSGPFNIDGERRVLAFRSEATNLVAADTNGVADVFVRELDPKNLDNPNDDVRRTQRVSVHFVRQCGEVLGRPFCLNIPVQVNGPSNNPDLSADGRLVAYESEATDLVTGDTNGFTDVFLTDRTAATTVRASVAFDGTQANDESLSPALEDGLVAFESSATNLVPGGSNGALQLFVRSSQGPVAQVSFSDDAIEANSQNVGPDLACSNDPTSPFHLRCDIAFSSVADNLVPGDTNADRDIFVRTQRVVR